MGYYDEDYDLDDNYGDEDQNDLMWLIDSWRPDDEEPKNAPAVSITITACREALEKAEAALAKAIRTQGDELPF